MSGKELGRITTLPLRDRSNAMLFGICAGLGRRTRTPPWVWRVALIVATLAGMGLPLVAYLVAALMAD